MCQQQQWVPPRRVLTWYSPWRALCRLPAAACRCTEPTWPPPPPARGPPTAPHTHTHTEENVGGENSESRGTWSDGGAGWAGLFSTLGSLHDQTCMYTNTDRHRREWGLHRGTLLWAETDLNLLSAHKELAVIMWNTLEHNLRFLSGALRRFWSRKVWF